MSPKKRGNLVIEIEVVEKKGFLSGLFGMLIKHLGRIDMGQIPALDELRLDVVRADGSPNDVRLEFLRERNGLFAVCRLADDGHVRLVVQHGLESDTHERVVVGDENPKLFHGWVSSC